MIAPEQVWLAVEPIDMRRGIDGLSLRIQQALGRSPCDGSAFAFTNRAGTRLKLLVWDGTGEPLAKLPAQSGQAAILARCERFLAAVERRPRARLS